MRGHPPGGEDWSVPTGSIPADAGPPGELRGREAGTQVYPRGCGATHLGDGETAPRRGLSPRMRGHLVVIAPGGRGDGSIPADAGPPSIEGIEILVPKVYPRGCGATFRWSTPTGTWSGLSPRMRGHRVGVPHVVRHRRSIPADAGPPTRTPACRPPGPVYPRGCGATVVFSSSVFSAEGLSPRMRGHRERPRCRSCRPGSIPADAGPPVCSLVVGSGIRVYPRGCGATGAPQGRDPAGHGLSPRMRGHPNPNAGSARGRGSIPADAGPPGRRKAAIQLGTVYPRGCGATQAELAGSGATGGLSPRMRGHPYPGDSSKGVDGSIPADAGPPSTEGCRSRHFQVYPRGCGATSYARPRLTLPTGLSPRMRGHPGSSCIVDGVSRSIPADAGPPQRRRAGRVRRAVYPRGCGATQNKEEYGDTVWGLSPRMRGHLSQALMHEREGGSIPADAGPPPSASPKATPRWVYPRGCGATTCRRQFREPTGGLSPRMRGHPGVNVGTIESPGSIPADAGPPYSAARARQSSRVYPRGCGATTQRAPTCQRSWGLSPRMRGHPQRLISSGPTSGSIPADAGPPGCQA